MKMRSTFIIIRHKSREALTTTVDTRVNPNLITCTLAVYLGSLDTLKIRTEILEVAVRTIFYIKSPFRTKANNVTIVMQLS